MNSLKAFQDILDIKNGSDCKMEKPHKPIEFEPTRTTFQDAFSNVMRDHMVKWEALEAHNGVILEMIVPLQKGFVEEITFHKNIRKIYDYCETLFDPSITWDEFLTQIYNKEDVQKELMGQKPLDHLKHIRTLREHLDNPIPPIEWIVQDIVPKRGITIFGGTSGSMKSFAGMQLSLACATGTDFLNQYETQKCNVLYIDEENGDRTTPYRFKMLSVGHGINAEPLDNLRISIFNNVQLDTLGGEELLNNLMRKFKPKLVIFDSMVRCMAGEEDKARDVKQIFQTLKPYLDQDVSFIILHHTAKREINSMAGLRGSGDFSAFADVILMFKSGTKGFCNVSMVKNRHIMKDDYSSFFFQIEEKEEGLALQWTGTSDSKGNVLERFIEEFTQYLKDEQKAKFKTKYAVDFANSKDFGRTTVYDSLKMMVDSGLLVKSVRGKYLVDSIQLMTVEEEIIK